MTLSALLEDEFEYVGAWRTADCRPHKLEWLKYKPGLYAFVIGDTVMYVGKAVTLHRRLRNYGNRTFRNGKKAQRSAHIGIGASVAGTVEVSIYAKVIADATKSSLYPIEKALIRKFGPAWNDD